MNKVKVDERLNKLIGDVTGYMHKPTEGMEPLDEQIAILAALGGIVIAIGNRMPNDAREYAQRLALDVAKQMLPPTTTSPIVGQHNHIPIIRTS